MKITAMSIIKFGEEIESGHISEVKNMSALKELAATSSAVKSLATILCADGTEVFISLIYIFKIFLYIILI